MSSTNVKHGLVAQGSAIVSGSVTKQLCFVVIPDGYSATVRTEFVARANNGTDSLSGHLLSAIRTSGSIVIDATLETLLTGSGHETWTCALTGSGSRLIAQFTGEVDHAIVCGTTMRII